MPLPTRPQQLGLLILLGFDHRPRHLQDVGNDLRPPILAILGPTATGKSALGIELALRRGGEIISCDSTAVYRGFDIGTDKVPLAERRGIPHHLIDIVEPTEEYTAARYVRDAVAAIEQIYDARAAGRSSWAAPDCTIARSCGVFFRARAPTRRCAAASNASRSAAASSFFTACSSAWTRRLRARIQPRDLKRMVRALEVYFLTGTPLTAHFAATVSPLAGYQTVAVALAPPMTLIAERVAKRVDAQFEQGLMDEIRGLLARGVPETARPFGGLVYRQALEHLHGVRE